MLILFFISLLNFCYKSLFKFVLFFIFVLILYKLLQPDNFFMIIKRVIHFYLLKVNFKKDFTINFLFIGMGGGTYSSRAALFFTGEYCFSF